jgi:hypothetical protein
VIRWGCLIRWHALHCEMPSGIRPNKTVGPCRHCACGVGNYPRNAHRCGLVYFGSGRYLYFRSCRQADLLLKPRGPSGPRGFYFYPAGPYGWTVRRKALWAQRRDLRRLDNLSRWPVPEWHNSRGRHLIKGPFRTHRLRIIPATWVTLLLRKGSQGAPACRSRGRRIRDRSP